MLLALVLRSNWQNSHRFLFEGVRPLNDSGSTPGMHVLAPWINIESNYLFFHLFWSIHNNLGGHMNFSFFQGFLKLWQNSDKTLTKLLQTLTKLWQNSDKLWQTLTKLWQTLTNSDKLWQTLTKLWQNSDKLWQTLTKLWQTLNQYLK